MFFQNVFRGANDWWRFLVTVIVVVIAYVMGQIPLGYLYMAAGNKAGIDDQMKLLEHLQKTDFDYVGMDLNVGLMLMLLIFVFSFAALWGMLRMLHDRTLITLITPLRNIDWSRIAFGFGFWLLAAVVVEGVAILLNPDQYTFQFSWTQFLPLLAIGLLLLPIQTTFEELFFRGYLLQGIGRWTSSKIAAVLITALLFALPHMFNPEVAKYGTGLMFTYYASFGIFLALITVWDNSLELAIGIHFANNLFSSLFVTFDDSALKAPALFSTSEIDVPFMLILFLLLGAVFIFICARKYNWPLMARLQEEVTPIPEPPMDTL